MSYTYANRKRTDNAAPKQNATPAQPSIDALRTGAAKPTAEQMGRRVDLPNAMRAKMEESFGADLSAVKLYESEAVGAAGAEAVAQGSNIAFAPGMLDFSSFGGQALLGHELSHVVSQARGEVAGGGFLNDHALEARADREGAMAAAGQQIAAPVAAMSSGSAVSAAGPMQASKKKGQTPPAQETATPAPVTDLTPKDVKHISHGNLGMALALQESVFGSNSGAYENDLQKYKAYFGGLKDIMGAMSPEALRADKDLQQFILQETSRVSNAEMLSELPSMKDKEGKIDQEKFEFGKLATSGLRGGYGDRAMGAFNFMTSRMLGTDKIADTLSDDTDQSLRKYSDLIAGDKDVAGLVEQFSDRAFSGIDVNDEQKSSGTMQAMYTLVAPTLVNAGRKDKFKQAHNAAAGAGYNPKTGIRGSDDAGKYYLNTIARRKANRAQH